MWNIDLGRENWRVNDFLLDSPINVENKTDFHITKRLQELKHS